MKLNRKAFANLIRSTSEADPEDFNMREYGNPCGTPACVLGNYANRTDLQDAFSFEPAQNGEVVSTTGDYVAYGGKLVQKHFGITTYDAAEIFSGESGCAGAKTPAEAVAFLEAFYAKRIAEEDAP